MAWQPTCIIAGEVGTTFSPASFAPDAYLMVNRFFGSLPWATTTGKLAEFGSTVAINASRTAEKASSGVTIEEDCASVIKIMNFSLTKHRKETTFLR